MKLTKILILKCIGPVTKNEEKMRSRKLPENKEILTRNNGTEKMIRFIKIDELK